MSKQAVSEPLTATRIPPRPEVGPVGRALRLVLALILLIALALAVFQFALLPPIPTVFVALVGIFPVTYIAYLGFAASAHRQRLEDDFRLLGLAREDEVADTVANLYQTVYSPGQFVVYVALVVVISLVTFWGYAGCNEGQTCGPLMDGETMGLIFFAYLGAYVFSVQELVRRYNTFDLQPQVYSSMAIRMLIAVAIVYVAAPVLKADPGGGGEPLWPAVVAFAIGVFPTQGLHFLSKIASRILTPEPSQRVALPLGNLLGIGPWHESRLVQMGIDDAQNLATVDIRRLLLTTQFDTQQIAHWVDQAILYVRVGERIARFRDAQISSYHELRLALARTPGEQAGEDTRARLAATFGLTHADELDTLADATSFPNYAHIAEFYRRSAEVARHRAGAAMGIVLGNPVEHDGRELAGGRNLPSPGGSRPDEAMDALAQARATLSSGSPKALAAGTKAPGGPVSRPESSSLTGSESPSDPPPMGRSADDKMA
jgi:hypothetical protein